MGRGWDADVEVREGSVVGKSVEVLGFEDDAITVKDEGVKGGAAAQGVEAEGDDG